MSFEVKTKKPGDMIRSEDWNEAMEEIGRLERTKLSLEGGGISGPLKIEKELSVKGKTSELLIEGSGKEGIKIKSADVKDPLIIGNGEIDSMVLHGSNVGIGTLDPLGKLEIRQDLDSSSDYALVISEPENSQKIYLNLANNDAGQYGYLHLGGANHLRGNGQPSEFDGDVSVGGVIRVRAEDPSLTIIREVGSGGKKLFLELFQSCSEDSSKDESVYPSIRFHQGNKYWIRMEGRNDGFHFKHGNLEDDSYVSVFGKNFATQSDARVKKDVEPLSESLKRISQLNGVSYQLNGDEGSNRSLGFLAQEVECVFPELISEDERGYKFLDYQGLLAPLTEAVKEQQNQIDDLRDKLENLLRKKAAL